MKPSTNTLNDMFSSDVRYIVPLYQRPYVWGQERHWQPLWEDIEVVLDHYLNGNGQLVTHFLGAIVLEQLDMPPGEPSSRLIIDGQQRLTTLQLLLAAAARCAEQDGAQPQARLLTKLIRNDPDLATGDAGFKVWPTNANQESFREVMQESALEAIGSNGSDNTIHEAYAYFVGAIEEWVHADDPSEELIEKRHEALRVALSSLLQVVSINLERGDNAQVIFETLNARGTPLLAMDLVKNAVFYSAERDALDVDRLNSEVWEPQLGDEYWRQSVRQGRLHRPRAELFLMHWLAMRLARMVPATELFSEFRSHVLDAPGKPEVESLVHELNRDASVLRGFDDQPPGSVGEQFFRHLNLLDTTTVMPIALLLYRHEELPEERRERGLQALESWLVRRMLCRYGSHGYNRLAADLLKQLHRDLDHADEVIVRFLETSAADFAVWPNDETLISQLTQRSLYGAVSQRRVVMVLSAIELALRRSNKVEDILALPPNLTVEHVMPQKWQEHWPFTAGFDAEERNIHIHRLGNLTLTSGPLNASLSNGPWARKRQELPEHTLLLLNRRVAAHEVWDEATIDARGEELARLVCEIWPGPTSGPTVPDTRKLTAEAINAVRQDGDTVDALLERMGFEPNHGRRARVSYLVNRGEVEAFETPSAVA